MTEKKLFAQGTIKQIIGYKLNREFIKVGLIRIFKAEKFSEKSPDFMGSIRLFEKGERDIILNISLWREDIE